MNEESLIHIGGINIPLWKDHFETDDDRIKKIRLLANYLYTFFTGIPETCRGSENVQEIINSIFSQGEIDEANILKIHFPETVSVALRLPELSFDLSGDDPTEVYTQVFVPKLNLLHVM